MKKFISILLAVIMMMTIIMIPVSAAETNDGSYAAPVFYGTQKRTNDNGTIDVRFVSVTNTLAGAKLGYEITASWWDATAKQYKEKVYSAANGHASLESSAIYASVEAGESTVTAADLGAKLGMSEPKGLFAVAINGVPAGIEVLFSVKTYVKNSEGEIVAENSAKEVIYENGQRSADRIIYSENFNGMSGAITYSADDTYKSAVTEALGWSTWINTSQTRPGLSLTAENNAMTVNFVSGFHGYTIVPKDTLVYGKDAYIGYTFESDVTANSLGLVGIVLNSQYANRHNEVGFRAYKDEGRTNTSAAETTYNGMYTTTGVPNSDGNAVRVNVGSNLGLEGYGYDQKFRLKIVVDMVNSTVKTYVNGSLIYDAKYNDSVDGGIILIGQSNANVTLDNILVTATPYVKTVTTVYEEDFDDITPQTITHESSESYDDYDSKLTSILGWKDANHQVASKGVDHLVITEDGKLKTTGDTSHAATYVLVSAGTMSNADKITFEADLTVEGMGWFGFLPGSNYANVKRSNFVGFRDYSSATATSPNGTSSTNKNYLGMIRGKGEAGTNNYYNNTFACEYETPMHIKIEIDTVASTITVWVNGTNAGVTSFAAADFDGGFSILCQKSIVTIDNIVITTEQ